MANFFDQFDPSEAPAAAKPAATGGNFFDQFDEGATPERSFTEKLRNFAHKVYENPPPSIAGIRDIMKAAPGAATELTYGADPEAAREAAGTIAQGAGLGLGFRGPGGTGVLGRPISAEARGAPIIPRAPIAPEAPPSTSQEAIAAAGRGGYTLPSYVTTEGTVIPQVASSIKNVPWGGQPITRTHDELLANMGRSKGDIVPAAPTPEQAGQGAKSGLTGFIKGRQVVVPGADEPQAVSKGYDAVDALIDPEIRSPLTNTAEMAQQLQAERRNARLPGSSKALDIVSGAIRPPTPPTIGGKPLPPALAAKLAESNPELFEPPGMNYAGTKYLRSYLGERNSQQLVAEGIDPIEAKRLYGALTKDLGNVVHAAGGEEGFAAWHKANRLAALSKAQQNALTKIVGVQGDAAPELVFERLAAFAGSKRGADINRLRLAKQAIGAGGWKGVGAAVIDRMGVAPDGSFSPKRFVTAYGNMAPAARSEVFSTQQQAALGDLFTVSKHIEDRITRFGNPSGTARGSIIGGAITGGTILAHPVGAITTLLGARMAAEALSRPAIVQAANAVSRAAAAGNPARTQRAIAALRATAIAQGVLPTVADQRQGGQPEARAEGGPVEEGKPYLMGEQGPEALISAAPIFADNPTLDAIERMHRSRQQAQGIDQPPTIVGQNGPEVVVPRQDGTVLPADDPFARAAARTGHRGRQEGAGTQFIEGGYGIPAVLRNLNEGARRAFESAGTLQRTGDQYDPAPVMQQALGAVGAPLVGPAIEGSVLGAGAIRRAAIPQVAKAELKAADAAPYPQYAESYPPVVPPELKVDPKTGKEFLGKVTSPEAKGFMREREAAIADMKGGYDPYYDPAKRFPADPSKYPAANVDTSTLQPAKPETVKKYLDAIDAPITRERLNKAFERGTELGNADNWYFMGQLENDFVKELGAKDGRKAFLERFAAPMAATTSGNNPTTNLLMSQYLGFLKEKGLPMPKGSYDMPSPIGGRFGMNNVLDWTRMQEKGGYAGLGADQPKMHNFARSFIGDLSHPVMDEQMTHGMLAGADPKLIEQARKGAYGLLEQPVVAEAKKRGIEPGAFQDVAWAGLKNEPGKPMISHVNDAIERTHRLTGMPREEIVRRGLIRQEIPIYGLTAPMPTGNQGE